MEGGQALRLPPSGKGDKGQWQGARVLKGANVEENVGAYENLLDHYEAPHNRGSCQNPTHCHTAENKACGDSVTIEVRVENGIIAASHFCGQGCCVSQAAASMLCQHVEGLEVQKAAALKPESVFELIGTQLTAKRQNCAILCLKALQMAISSCVADKR